MIWHVPNNVPSRSISDEAFFKYYTDTHFLKTYGSTLQSLFTEYAPLRQAAIAGNAGRVSLFQLFSVSSFAWRGVCTETVSKLTKIFITLMTTIDAALEFALFSCSAVQYFVFMAVGRLNINSRQTFYLLWFPRWCTLAWWIPFLYCIIDWTVYQEFDKAWIIDDILLKNCFLIWRFIDFFAHSQTWINNRCNFSLKQLIVKLCWD